MNISINAWSIEALTLLKNGKYVNRIKDNFVFQSYQADGR